MASPEAAPHPRRTLQNSLDWLAGRDKTFLPKFRQRMLDWLVEHAMSECRVDMCNIQLVDEANGTLVLTAHYGFDRPFLEFFDVVEDGNCACGAALHRQKQIVVEDVTRSSIFKDNAVLETILDARVRAVQSTPIVSSSGSVLGMFSTHYRRPTRIEIEHLERASRIADMAADLIVL